MKKLFLSMHVPKTAGTAFALSVKETFEKNKVHVFEGPNHISSREALVSFSEQKKNDLMIVHGHFSFGLHKAFENREVSYLSFVRNPIDRLVSLYYFIKSSQQHPRHKIIVENNWSLREFVESGINPELENCQTKMFSGRPESDFLVGHQPCSDADLDRAKKHIEAYFPVVGLTESFEESLDLINSKFDWHIASAGRRNVTKGRAGLDDIDARSRKAVEQLNLYDVELYRYASENFKKALKLNQRKIFIYATRRKLKNFNQKLSNSAVRLKAYQHRLSS